MVSKVQEYRLRAKLSKNRFCKLADVDYQTLTKAEEGRPIYDYNAQKIADTLSQTLGQTITIEELGVQIYQAPARVKEMKPQFKRPGLLHNDK